MSAQTLEKNETSGSESEAFAIDLLLEDAMSKYGGNLVEKNILHLLREFKSNDISGNLRSTIRRLKERLSGGEDPPEIQMMLRIILRSKEKMLEEQQGSRCGTPASSDDEDEEEEDDPFQSSSPFFDVANEEEEDEPLQDYLYTRCSISTTTPPTWDSEDNKECYIPTSTPPTSDSEDDEEVYPVAFINKATEQHPNSHFTIEQKRKTIVLSRNKEKMLKVERNMLHVAKTPKPFKKIKSRSSYRSGRQGTTNQ